MAGLPSLRLVSSMGDEIISHDPVSSKKEAIEREWRDWLKAYENHSNWYGEISCYAKLQILIYQIVEEECWEILVEAYEKVSIARKATMLDCKPRNQTSLHLLVARSTPQEVIEKVLGHINGDEVNIKDEEGNTVLHVAATTKGIENIGICKLILSYFPDLIEECNNRGNTALSLLTRCFDGSWNDRVDRYEDMINTLNLTKVPPHSTPMHIALNKSKDAKAAFEHVKDKKNMLKIKDEKGNTALHLAASRSGMKDLCKSMADACPELLNEANCKGETPLFIAAKYRFLINNYRIFYKYADRNTTIDMPSGDGNTILHCALLSENFVWAYQILEMHPSFRSTENKDGLTPLKILTNNPSAFRSRTPLTMVEHIIYSCIWVVDLVDKWKSEVDYCRQEVSECFNTFKRLIMSGLQMMHKILSSQSCCLGNTIPKDESESAKDLEKPGHEHIIGEDVLTVSESDEERPIMALIKSFIKTCIAPIKSFIKICMAPIKIIVSFLIKHILPGKLVRKIENIKRRHMLAYRIMEKLLLNYEASLEDPPIGNATILIAAEKGVTEMVEGIFGKNPKAGSCMREIDLKNALLLAIENRQADVYELLTNLKKKGIKIKRRWDDHKENNALHLAATRSSRQPWGMPTTMHLLWEIKWYNYVRDTMPDELSIDQNSGGKSPEEVFMEEHKDLLQKNDLKEWLKATSQSCSVVAGLVATVAYSSATTIPGGNNQEGVPYFKGHPAFGTFVISAFIALCFSLISLIMFLTILISPYLGIEDANKSLPTKLVVALFSLLASIGTMLVSFCGGHFFYLKGTFTYAAAPFYAIGCLVIAFLLFTQFNSYTSLLWSLSRHKPRPWYDRDSLETVVYAAYYGN